MVVQARCPMAAHRKLTLPILFLIVFVLVPSVTAPRDRPASSTSTTHLLARPLTKWLRYKILRCFWGAEVCLAIILSFSLILLFFLVAQLFLASGATAPVSVKIFSKGENGPWVMVLLSMLHMLDPSFFSFIEIKPKPLSLFALLLFVLTLSSACRGLEDPEWAGRVSLGIGSLRGSCSG